MCGILAIFSSGNKVFTESNIRTFLSRQEWRGPDNTGVWVDHPNNVYLGHNRLTILDSSPLANMPMQSLCGRYILVYNGEIYNHFELRKRFDLDCKTNSDSETLINLFSRIGIECIDYLEGMFAFVIFDTLEKSYFAARDKLGIKPLYYSEFEGLIVFGSEPAVINDVVQGDISKIAIEEWRVFRRPIGGKTFFERVNEIPPGHFYTSGYGIRKYWEPCYCGPHNHDEFKFELISSVKSHLLNDYETVSLLSGGLDSAVVLGISAVKKAYTIGLKANNEFLGAEESATKLGVNLVKVQVTDENLTQAWKTLIKTRREPLSVPNEGLIYLVCNAMTKSEKVVLTGEGADELLFGYDRIFRWASNQPFVSLDQFISYYSYTNLPNLDSITYDCIADLMRGKSGIDFVEDFFIQVHLPGLLRRMDAASMCASKEARVPFVVPALFNLMYRQHINSRYFDGYPKSSLRTIAKDLNLFGALTRKKIGFSAATKSVSQKEEYKKFQDLCINELRWG